jgi:MinD-like ATPase involved in chromosome partitioning or flagellar assembly
VDLPTYTNIWRIEKRLYKLYDFRLPAPLPITWIAVFAGITVPYIFFLVIIGLPFNHTLVWLYVLPPGVLTWLITRPVIENKRLPELVSSQLRYLSEPHTWCRMAPFAEKDDVHVSVRVWHRHPPGARPRKARKAVGRTRSAGGAVEAAASQAAQPVAAQPVAAQPVAAQPVMAQPVMAPPPQPESRPVPAVTPAQAPAGPLRVRQRAAARPEAERADAFPEAGPFPEAEAVAEPGAMLELEPLPDPDLAPAAKRRLRSYHRSSPDPASAPSAAPASPGRSVAAKVAALLVAPDGDRPVPSAERALSGPDRLDDVSWPRRVKVVTGGQGPGQRDQETRDRNRARLPLPGARRIAVLGCTSGAGQSVIALMTGHTLAAARAVPVAVLDLNPGEGSLAALVAPVTSVTALLAGPGPDPQPGDDSGAAQALAWSGRGRSPGRLDIVADDSTRALGPEDYQQLADLLAERYPLTMIDPAPSGLARLLSLADQLVLVTPASPAAATALAHTQQWLSAHGHDGLAAGAVTVVNGVSRRSMQDVLQAESVARGRCRAIVRVPWDDRLSPGVSRAADSLAVLGPQTRLAYTALAGVLVAGLAPRAAEPGTPAASPRTRVPGRSSGERAD